MAYYRLYHCDDHGHIHRVSDQQCASDQEAMGVAQSVVTGEFHVEVWCLDRRVGRIDRRGGIDAAVPVTSPKE